MKNCFIIAFALLAMSCMGNSETVISLRVEGNRPTPIAVHMQDSVYLTTLDSTGATVITLAENFIPGYAIIQLGRMQVPVYVEMGKSFDLFVKFERAKYKVASTFSGEGAVKNTYLNSEIFKKKVASYENDEEAFFKALECAEKEQIAYLEAQGFDARFVALEKRRIHYGIYSIVMMYPACHAQHAEGKEYVPAESFYERVKAAIVEEPELIHLREYRDILKSYTTFFSKETGSKNGLELMRAKVDFILKNFTAPEIVEYLIDNVVTEYVSKFGVDDLEDVIDVYNAKVSSVDKKMAFEALYDKWIRVSKGYPAINFKYLDIHGNEVSLEDLAGKYVYIDCWATWCGPCRGELPYLQELEHRYKDKNIHFVSISSDQDKGAWEKMVKEKKMGGIQLHDGGDSAFMDFFMIRGIPRFILLDREGKIVMANAPRPSNPETAKIFDSLEGI